AAIPIMMLIGWGTVTQLTLTNTLIQLSIPDHLRGRVIATYIWVMQGTAPFGSLFIGWLAQEWGAPTAVLVGGFICVAGFMLFHLARPTLRRTITQV
ncbi:MAG TPA: MFS transporter, partial [Anaerolineaceae bacterium]|nr:MFS transporter [Anaerolineaceae bacterium]